MTHADFHSLASAGKQQRVEGDAEVEAAKVCTRLLVFGFLICSLSYVRPSRVDFSIQTKGYAEGAGDSLAGGLKKNVHKVTGNDAKQAEGELVIPGYSLCSLC